MTRARFGTAVTIAVAALVVGAVFGRAGSVRAATGVPTNTAKPTISGTAQEGQTLTASNGTWDGSPTSYTYAWNRCDANGGACAAIASATASTYKVASTDVGHTLTVTVTAKNATGSSQPASSDPTAVVGAPANTAAPTISGTLAIGSTLTANAGTWTESPTSYAYAWSRCDAKGANCATISGATKSTYTLTRADAGTTLLVTVTATNAAGTGKPATSAATAAVPEFNGCPIGTGTIQIADLVPPARLLISRATITPQVVTLGTRAIQLHVKVTACGGRPVQGATVFASAIPYNQFAAVQRTTGSSGTATLTETRERGFPARSRNQHLLPVLVRATKPGERLVAGVSTRRMVAFRVAE